MRPIAPFGVQQAERDRAAGRQTRNSSSAVRRWSGANMWPKVEMTRSKLASSNGSSCASASIHSTSTIASAARSRAMKAGRRRSRAR